MIKFNVPKVISALGILTFIKSAHSVHIVQFNQRDQSLVQLVTMDLVISITSVWKQLVINAVEVFTLLSPKKTHQINVLTVLLVMFVSVQLHRQLPKM